MPNRIALAALAAALLAGQAAAADWGVEVDHLYQDADVENALALAIDDSRAFAGVNYACGIKAKRIDQRLEADNVLALAISGSQAAAGSNIAGDGRCME